MGVRKATSIQTFDFSTPYTSIPHDLLKCRINNIINNAFKHKNRATRFTHVKAGRNKNYFTNDPSNGDNKYTSSDICKMMEFLVNNMYVRFCGQLFRQAVGIPMGTNCAPLLADLFLYSYENEFLDKFIKGQLQRFHKLISNDRIWPSEHGFEVIFEKSLFVFEISAFKVRNKHGIHSRFHSFSENNNRETLVCDVTSDQSSMISTERSDLRDCKASRNC